MAERKKKYKKIIKIVIYFHLVLLVIFGIFVAHLWWSNSNDYDKGIAEAPYDVIIVPGLPYADSTDYGNLLLMRVYWSKYLLDRDIAQHVIYSGSAVYTPYVESIIMKKMAIGIGVPDSVILTEEKAEHSTENVYYSYQIAKEKGWEKVAVATDPFQSYMLSNFIDEHEFPINVLPMSTNAIDAGNLVSPEIDPSEAYREDFIALPEREGRWERFRGTLGRHIDFEE